MHPYGALMQIKTDGRISTLRCSSIVLEMTNHCIWGTCTFSHSNHSLLRCSALSCLSPNTNTIVGKNMTNHCIWGYPIFRQPKWMNKHPSPSLSGGGNAAAWKSNTEMLWESPQEYRLRFQIWSIFNIVEPDLR